MMRSFRYSAPLIALALLTACQSSPPPKGVKVGKPYTIGSKTYYPSYDATYDETGIASWYGPGFHGNRTANGEKFDTHDLTAAHPTLPMPSIVRVTNLQNGKSAIVRINDRGPFKDDRIIDLSRASAKRLDIHGLAKVRVQYLADESEQYLQALEEGRRIDMFAYNTQVESQKDATILAATAPSDKSFIIESTEVQTQPGDTVANAAPIISVSDTDLPVKGEKKIGGGVLISQAWADERPSTIGKRGGEVVLKSPGIAGGGDTVDAPEEVSVASLPEVPAPAAKAAFTPPPPAAGSGIYIQVGSFSQQANAEKMQRAISPAAKADMALVEVGGHSWWRLRAGPFASKNDAELALNDIRERGAPDARIMYQ